MYNERKLVIHIHELLEKRGWSLSKLALEADIDKGKLSLLANGRRESIYIDYIIKIAETLDIDDINEIISIERVNEKGKEG
ncbi:helix-turn-helix transcriptional regulator [Lederbergia sp. NSJ-179]|uniref:helix-turn-helix domain-containing protein n=1 Tax=Lederbergia sp. NSJ-179 TaxID=2931402 RepID=UPI001FD48556|nr:helix-turn-helix transcriptional regulator [Lederbergia sp. NSJ-179]MCJ7840692.1 helix-turn-helix transcriptional regulator [Lederbergia sp. NSJ-179]